MQFRTLIESLPHLFNATWFTVNVSENETNITNIRNRLYVTLAGTMGCDC